MKITCRPDVLGPALQAAGRAVSPRSTLPILGSLLLEAEGDQLAVSATNLELSIRKTAGVEVGEAGTAAVPARLLTEFVASLPAEDLVARLDGDDLRLACGRFTTRIRCFPATDFPPIPRVEGAARVVGSMPTAEFLRGLEQTVLAASSDEARPVLTGVLLELGVEGRLLAATDGHRLAIREFGGADGHDGRYIVPARCLAELSRAFRGEGDEVEIAVAEAGNAVFFRCGTAEVGTRLIDGTYPNYGQVVPKRSTTTVDMSTASLSQALKGVSLFAQGAANVVKFQVDGDSLTLSAATNELGDGQAVVDARVEGEPVSIAFNARYVTDVLGVIGDAVRFSLDGPLSPAMITGGGDGEPVYRHVIMPIRVAS